jgi:hypothetical protein
MGEVYRARDTKLKRDVALKVLPDSFGSDPDRLARFSREAQTLASLNHPNIAHIHGLEESEGVTAIVMELVEGDDLAQRIARGAMPIDEALPIAKQIAEALEAAHEQGIIHRDLKPANIKVRDDGAVKVLDFGLAKALDPTSSSGAEAMDSPTLTRLRQGYGAAGGEPGTEMGVIPGTAAYMAPEQASGKAVDKRADIWSFGVVLWEILSGRRLFDGETVSHTLADVLRAPVDLGQLPADTRRAAPGSRCESVEHGVQHAHAAGVRERAERCPAGLARVLVSRFGEQALEDPEVLQHLGGPVARELVFVRQQGQHVAHDVSTHRLEPDLCGVANPPLTVGEERGDQRRPLDVLQRAERASRMRPDEPRLVAEPRPCAGHRLGAAEGRERFERRAPDHRRLVPREPGEGRVRSLERGKSTPQQCAPVADHVVGVVQRRPDENRQVPVGALEEGGDA